MTPKEASLRFPQAEEGDTKKWLSLDYTLSSNTERCGSYPKNEALGKEEKQKTKTKTKKHDGGGGSAKLYKYKIFRRTGGAKKQYKY